ncbi:Polypeptide N-acetylgalactosaminyltransferase 10 [Bulinus truncatus]|nr:Polypeptide N-acetylgalactosaminyltransferase 10 [Bulinus truncatus]
MARLSINSPLAIIIVFLVIFLLVNLSLIYVAQTNFQVDINHELSRILKRSVINKINPIYDVDADQRHGQGSKSAVAQERSMVSTNRVDSAASTVPEFQFLEDMYEDYYVDENQLGTEYFDENVVDGNEQFDEIPDNNEIPSESNGAEFVVEEMEENKEDSDRQFSDSGKPEFQYLEEMYEDYYEDDGEEIRDDKEVVFDGVEDYWDGNYDANDTSHLGFVGVRHGDELETEENVVEFDRYGKAFMTNVYYVKENGEFVEENGEFVEEAGEFVEENGEFLEENGEFVDEAGELVEEAGEFLEENGEFVDEAGELVEEAGEFVEEAGELVEEAGEFLEEAGEFVEEKGKFAEENAQFIRNTEAIDRNNIRALVKARNEKWVSSNRGEDNDGDPGKSLTYVISKNSNILDNREWAYLTRKVNQSQVSLEEYRSGRLTGNLLIDLYGKNDLMGRGEMGKPVILTQEEAGQVGLAMSEFNMNTVASDVVPLNRLVPDSRLKHCDQLKYDERTLPRASIIVPFFNESPTFLIRTVYSVINRSPRRLVEEIILVDDGSTLEWLKEQLEMYIAANFPHGLVRLVRQTERQGLIKARMRGCQEAKGEVLIFFDSHMEVNVDWLPPLLAEIAKDRTVVAMATLDYIQPDTLEYKFYRDYLIRYGWNWRLGFYELYFRDDQIGPDPRQPRPGPVMVGAAFAIDKKYFLHLGGYDEAMSIWGGENLEMGWRVWLCGGQLLHVPCSRVGHVERKQPYSFPGGREHIEHFNYKRATSVWMGNYTRYVYSIYPDMKTLNVGDISKRLELKAKLNCKDFGWYLENIWPELSVFDENVFQWGQVQNKGSGQCLDNDNNLYQDEMPLYLNPCNGSLDYQAFALTREQLLKTSLSCVVAHKVSQGGRVKMEDCIIGSRDKWTYTKDEQLVHQSSQMCLDVMSGHPVLNTCRVDRYTQQWTFVPYTF